MRKAATEGDESPEIVMEKLLITIFFSSKNISTSSILIFKKREATEREETFFSLFTPDNNVLSLEAASSANADVIIETRRQRKNVNKELV